jgi:hypothetical protein
MTGLDGAVLPPIFHVVDVLLDVVVNIIPSTLSAVPDVMEVAPVIYTTELTVIILPPAVDGVMLYRIPEMLETLVPIFILLPPGSQIGNFEADDTGKAVPLTKMVPDCAKPAEAAKENTAVTMTLHR